MVSIDDVGFEDKDADHSAFKNTQQGGLRGTVVEPKDSENFCHLPNDMLGKREFLGSDDFVCCFFQSLL